MQLQSYPAHNHKVSPYTRASCLSSVHTQNWKHVNTSSLSPYFPFQTYLLFKKSFLRPYRIFFLLRRFTSGLKRVTTLVRACVRARAHTLTSARALHSRVQYWIVLFLSCTKYEIYTTWFKNNGISRGLKKKTDFQLGKHVCVWMSVGSCDSL